MVRLIVSSANLTKFGYRRNHEIAGTLEFYNDKSSAPRQVILDALTFLSELIDAGWIAAASQPSERVAGPVDANDPIVPL